MKKFKFILCLLIAAWSVNTDLLASDDPFEDAANQAKAAASADDIFEAEAAEVQISPFLTVGHMLHTLDTVNNNGLLSSSSIEHLCASCSNGVHTLLGSVHRE